MLMVRGGRAAGAGAGDTAAAPATSTFQTPELLIV